MKKLIVTCSAILMAVAAHAVSYTWGLSSYDYADHNGTPLETGSAFLFLGTVTATDTAFDTSAATFVTSGGFDADNYAYGSIVETNLQSSDAVTSTAAGQAYSIVLLEESGVNSLDGYEGYYTILTGESTLGVLPGATNTYFAQFVNYDSAYTTSQMSAASPIPEPTSGLLMLLGMAGLALKRKRA